MLAGDEANVETVDAVADDAAALVQHLRWWLEDPTVSTATENAARIRWAVWAIRTVADGLALEVGPRYVARALGVTERQARHAMSLIGTEPPEPPTGSGARVLRLSPEGEG